MSDDLKAWWVREYAADGSMVLFAKTRGQAKRYGCGELDAEFTALRVNRVPAFDDLAPGPVTQVDYLKRGFWTCCVRCGAHVCDEDAVVEGDDWVYCQPCGSKRAAAKEGAAA